MYAATVILDQPVSAYHQTLQRLSNETNGDYYRTSVSFKNVFTGVEKASSGYYLITYRTKKAPEAKGKSGSSAAMYRFPLLRLS